MFRSAHDPAGRFSSVTEFVRAISRNRPSRSSTQTYLRVLATSAFSSSNLNLDSANELVGLELYRCRSQLKLMPGSRHGSLRRRLGETPMRIMGMCSGRETD